MKKVKNAIVFLLSLASACSWQSTTVMGENAKLTLADNGRTAYVITLAKDHSAPQQHAAQELAHFLKEVTGADFAIVAPEESGTRPVIAVGPNAAKKVAPDLDLNALGQEGIVIQTQGPHLILTGGPDASRGTLYAVYTFLEDTVGCHWWTAKVSTIPHRTTLTIPELKRRHIPPFEYREPCILEAREPNWAVRNRCNGANFELDAGRGGCVSYQGGFVHTADTWFPVAEYFPKHPKWFSEIGGKRVGTPGACQWCLTNPELLAACIQRTKALLRTAPPDSIVSVSQVDCLFRCECAKCMAIEKEEKNPSGPLLRFVNAVADAIKDEYPRAAIDTLAYQYTRKPPRLTKARPNVIVRLCSIECPLLVPLDDPKNKGFIDDVNSWSAICHRVYVWTYITDFGHYLLPTPVVHVLGTNMRVLAAHGVRGVFGQGDYNSRGGNFSDLEAWLLAKLLWDPTADDRALIREFVDGYYGPAAPQLAEYLKLLHDAPATTERALSSDGSPISPELAPYLTPAFLTRAEALFREADAAAAKQPDVLCRVRVAHASVQYAALITWLPLKNAFAKQGRPWPFGASYHALAKQLYKVVQEDDITRVEEGPTTPVEFFQRHLDITGPRAGAAPPELCKNLDEADWADIQESQMNVLLPGKWTEVRDDKTASNGRAVWMPATHGEAALKMQIPIGLWMDHTDAQWTAYAMVRVDKKGKGDGTAFSCGIYDSADPKTSVSRTVALSEIKDGAYHAYRVGKTPMTTSRMVWMSPTGNRDNVAGIWIDRIFFVRERTQ